jgi:hypothetical protein
MRLLAALLCALFGLVIPLPAAAATIGGNPGPQHNYVCPHADSGGPLDCYFDAVVHLYTMCRNVHAIEIIEFGYEDSQEGEHAAKYEYCLDKQKQNIAPRYKAALKEAHVSKQAVEGVRSLHEYWLGAMQHIRWNKGESDDAYKTRLAQAYDEFKAKIQGIRTIVALVKEKTSPVAKAKASTPSGKTDRSGGKASARPGKPEKSTPKTATAEKAS